MKIAILTPTRGRPDRLQNFIKSTLETATYPELVVHYCYVDSDDSKARDYDESLALMQISKQVKLVIGEPKSVSKSWNDLAELAYEDVCDVMIMGNDDMVYLTPGWDEIIREEAKNFPDNIYCMWAEDGINGADHCAFPIVSRKWYSILGYFTPGVFHFGYNDTWVFDVAKRIGRAHFVPRIKNEHRHFTAGKSEYDDTYARNRTQERGNLYAKDAILFEQFSDQREAAAQMLRQYMLK